MEMIDGSGDAMLHKCFAEVEQVTKPLVCEAQVGQELLLVCVAESLRTLEFDDDLVFDDEIRPEALVESESLICNRNGDLSVHLQAAASQLVRKDDFIHRLQQARSHVSMEDRKSTRLNSSHSQISYAVFCLKKKKTKKHVLIKS